MPLQAVLPYLALLVVVGLNICANVLLKIGSMAATGASALSAINIPTVAGLGCFGLAVVAYSWSLRTVPLYVAQSMLSLQYLGIVVAAALVFGEALAPRAWLGAVLIAAGLAIVATASLR